MDKLINKVQNTRPENPPETTLIRMTLHATLLCAGALFCHLALAQTSAPADPKWPVKPIRVVVPFAAGSFTDTAARTVGNELGELLGQPVIVENKGGAGSTLGTDIVAKAAPDGYTFLVTDNSFAVAAALYEKLPYSASKDLSAVSLLADAPAMLVARPDLPAGTLGEAVDAIRKAPGAMTYGSGGQGSSAHLAMLAFLLQNNLEMTHVPFKGIAAAIVDVSAGRVDLAIGSIGSTSAQIRDRRLKGLAISGDARLAAFPDIPTFAEAGFKDYRMLYWFGMFAPAGTPPAIIDRLQQAIAKAVAAPRVREVFAAAGVRPAASTPEAFARIVSDEQARWADIISRARVKTE